MFFVSWSRLGVLLAAACMSYIVVVITLRVSGKRTLAKLNAFDFVVTIALGSVLATSVVSRQVPVTEGALALVMLCLLQFVVAWLTARVRWIRRAVTATPTALVVDGEVRTAALRKCRVSEEELAATLRQASVASLSQVTCVVLETDGTISVITERPDDFVLRSVDGASVDPSGHVHGAGPKLRS